jgi:hypothetical protein
MAKVYAQLDDRLRKFILAQPIFFVATAPSAPAAGDGGHVNVSPKGYRDTFAIIGPRTVAYLDLTGSGAETIAHLRQNGRITIMFCSFDRAPKILRLYGTGRVVLPADQDWSRLAAHFGGAGQATNGYPPNGQAPNGQAPNGQATNGQAADDSNANGHDPELGTERHAGTGADRGIQPVEHDAERNLERGADRGNRRAIIVSELDRIADSCGYAVPVMELAEERDLLSRWSEKRTPEQLAAYRADLNAVSIDGLPALG